MLIVVAFCPKSLLFPISDKFFPRNNCNCTKISKQNYEKQIKVSKITQSRFLAAKVKCTTEALKA